MVEVESPTEHPPTFRRCDCVLRLDVLQNVEKGMAGLSKAPVVQNSPLLEREGKNLWITAGEEFHAHLRHVAVRKPTTWVFRVISDAELVTAWLASIALKGEEIRDPDAYLISTRFLTIPDLVVPPDLVVIRMGIKVARNAAASEVLAEAINSRYHENKPTWFWDEPAAQMGPGHLFWSEQVGRILRPWERIKDLAAPSAGSPKKKAASSSSAGPGTKKTLRGGTT